MLLLNEKTLPHKNFCQAIQQNNQICGRTDCKIHYAKIFLEKHFHDEKDDREIEKEKKKAEKEIEKEKKKAGKEIEKEKKKAEKEIEKEKKVEEKVDEEVEKEKEKVEEEVKILIPQYTLPFPMFDRFGIPVSHVTKCNFGDEKIEEKNRISVPRVALPFGISSGYGRVKF